MQTSKNMTRILHGRWNWARTWIILTLTTFGLVTLTILFMQVYEMQIQSVSLSVGKWLLDDTINTSTLCQSLEMTYKKKQYVPFRATGPIAWPLLIRHPKARDLDPKPLDYQTEIKRYSVENLSHRPPQALLLGFAKCGTTALLAFLKLHSKIVSLDWETDYFCDRMYAKYDLQWYVKRMPPSLPDQVTIEKSPCYIVESEAHKRMYAMNSSLKIMVLVRNPIVRLLSEYAHYYSWQTYFGREPVPLIDRISDRKTGKFRTDQLLKVGNYLQHIRHLFDVFPRNQVLILDGDKLITNPLAELAKVESFLGLDHEITSSDIYFDEEKGFYCMRLRETGEHQCLGDSKGRQHEQLDPELVSRLNEFYKPYNQELFAVLAQDFGWVDNNKSIT